jgi:hypothetical protein
MKLERSLLIVTLLATMCMGLFALEEPTFNGEIYIRVNSGISADIAVEAVSTIWGKYSQGFPITTSYSGASVTGQTGLAFDNCDSWNTNENAIGYALYYIGVTYGGSNHHIYVDWRDCDYPTLTNYTNGDLAIFFDVYTGTWEANNNSISNGSTVCIWAANAGMKSVNTQNTAALTPTDPSGLSLSNSNGHPRLAWYGSEPSSAKYVVYRGATQITDPPISNTYYVDEDYQIMSTGGRVIYKVRAVSGDGSKYSDNYTDTVSTLAVSLLKPGETGKPGSQFGSTVIGTYPNPFNPQTCIRFVLSEDGHARLAVYDLLGREILQLVEGNFKAGAHEAIWKGVDAGGMVVPSGAYIYRLQHSRGMNQGTMLLLK